MESKRSDNQIKGRCTEETRARNPMGNAKDPLYEWAQRHMTHPIGNGQFATDGDIVTWLDTRKNFWRHGRLLKWTRRKAHVLHAGKVIFMHPSDLRLEGANSEVRKAKALSSV
jgi:hypothetical protein